MKLSKFIFLFIFVISSCQTIFAECPTVIRNGKKYYCYEIKKGDSLYGIANNNGWDIDILRAENPGSVNGIKHGAMLYYPAGNIVDKKDNTIGIVRNDFPAVHVVKKGETIYSISMRYGISPDDLCEANPQIRKGLKAEDTIKIPVNKDVKQISKVENVNNTDSQKVKKNTTESNAENRIAANDNSIDNLPVIGGVNDNGVLEQKNNVKVALFLDQPSSRRDLEFTRGMLVALDELKDKDFKTSFKVFDGRLSERNIVEGLNAFSPDFIISTAENLPSFLTGYATDKKLNLINVFDVKNKLYETEPEVVQLMIPSDNFNRKVSEFIGNKFNNSVLLVAGTPDSNDYIFEELKLQFGPMRTQYISIDDMKEMPVKDGLTYLVYGTDVKKDEIENLFKGVESMASRTIFSTFSVLGRPNWILLENELQELKPNFDFYIPSRYYFDQMSQDGKEFLEHFNKLFNRKPQKSFPVYAVEGYDVARFFIPGFIRNNGDFTNHDLDISTLQSHINLEKENGLSGLVNTGCYIMRYLPNSGKEKIYLK